MVKSMNSTKTKEIFSILASNTRVRILKILSKEQPLSFTLLMKKLGLDPKKDAGTFSYHINNLLSLGLITKSREYKRGYQLSDLGYEMARFITRIEELAEEKYSIEVIDYTQLLRYPLNDKIIEDLLDVADLVDNEKTELLREIKQILNLRRAKIITSEMLSAIIMYKLLEEGIPIENIRNIEKYKYNATVKNKIWPNKFDFLRNIHKLDFTTVLSLANKEFLLYEYFPNLVNLTLDIRGLYSILKNRVHRDLLKNLDTFFLVLYELVLSNPRIDITLTDFNFQILPLIANVPFEILKKAIMRFLYRFACHIENFPKLALIFTTSFSKDLINYSNSSEIFGKNLTFFDVEDYYEDAMKFMYAFLESYSEISRKYPLLSPRIIFKLNRNSFNESQEILNDELRVFLKNSMSSVGFINTNPNWQGSRVAYTFNFNRIYSNEEMLVKGIHNRLYINIPRIAYMANFDESYFIDKLIDSVKLAVRTLHAVSQKTTYYVSSIISERNLKTYSNELHNLIVLVGLNEAVKILTNSWPWNEKTSEKLLYKIIVNANDAINNIEKNNTINERAVIASNYHPDIGVYFSDIDFKDGFNISHGNRRRFSVYTSNSQLANISLLSKIRYESLMHPQLSGGHVFTLAVDREIKIDNKQDIFEIINKLLTTSIGSFLFSKKFTYCMNCGFFSHDLFQRCQKCNETSAIISITNYNGYIRYLK